MKHPDLRHHPLITGTLILTATGFLTRLIGFFYRIYLSQLIGAEGMGIYQLIGPVSGICFALCCGPIQTAVSRFVASAAATGKQSEIRSSYYGGLLLSELLALLTAFFIFTNAGWLAENVLHESRCRMLLQLLALSLPASAASSAIKGYYYGLQKTKIPALSQLTEQVFRVLFIYFLTSRVSSQNGSISVNIAGIGLLAGEVAGFLLSLIAIQRNWHLLKRTESFCNTIAPGQSMGKIIRMATPLTANRLVLGVLQSAEAIQIPERLLRYGLSSSAALSLYGVLSGMAMPFIFFPSALTGSLAVMLLPKVAEAESTGNEEQLKKTAELSVGYSLYIGILFTGIFITFGKEMGDFFFHNTEAGSYIQILGWLCPFMYVSSMTGSILNGLGRTATTFWQGLAGLSLRLLFVIFLIPRLGIHAYLLGMLASELLVAGLHVLFLRKDIPFSFSALYRLFRPMTAITLAILLEQRLPAARGIFTLFLHCGWVTLFYLCFLVVTRRKKE